MEDIAHRTKQETTSMHIITFVTMVFLPGTFVAVSDYIFPICLVLTEFADFLSERYT